MSTSVDLSKWNSSVAPFSLFISFFSFFYFFIFSGLIGSFYLSIICPLWDLLFCPLWDLLFFPHFKGNTLYFTRSIEDLHTIQEVLNIKRMKTIMMYANVCLCECSRICNDTSTSCRNYNGNAQLACGSLIKQNHV